MASMQGDLNANANLAMMLARLTGVEADAAQSAAVDWFNRL
jgi:hypothetical protein